MFLTNPAKPKPYTKYSAGGRMFTQKSTQYFRSFTHPGQPLRICCQTAGQRFHTAGSLSLVKNLMSGSAYFN